MIDFCFFVSHIFKVVGSLYLLYVVIFGSRHLLYFVILGSLDLLYFVIYHQPGCAK